VGRKCESSPWWSNEQQKYFSHRAWLTRLERIDSTHLTRHIFLFPFPTLMTDRLLPCPVVAFLCFHRGAARLSDLISVAPWMALRGFPSFLGETSMRSILLEYFDCSTYGSHALHSLIFAASALHLLTVTGDEGLSSRIPLDLNLAAYEQQCPQGSCDLSTQYQSLSQFNPLHLSTSATSPL
jgi:hypothetical protein